MTPDPSHLITPNICPTCTIELIGKYCHNCGEKKISSSDYSIARFLEDSVHILTHLDSRFYRSVRLLMSRPGYLTAEYFEGRCVPYVKPVQLFLLINVLYFLAVSLFGWNTFATHLDIHRNNGYYGSLASSMVEARLADRRITLEEYRTTFDHASTTFSKSLIFTMVPFLALILQGLYWRPRRYYVEDLTLSVHFFTFLLLYLVGVGLLLKLALLVPNLQSRRVLITYGDLIGTLFVAAGTFTYLYLALRRLRLQSVLLTLVKVMIITYGSFWLLWIYRFILFVSCFTIT